MRWAEGFIAADWGTTNRRAYLMDGGKCVDEFEDDKGILGVPKGGFGDAVAEIRERLGDRPLLLAGMVGSNRGWIEAPYVPCPAGILDLVANLVWPEAGRTAIVPKVVSTAARPASCCSASPPAGSRWLNGSVARWPRWRRHRSPWARWT